MAVCQVAAAADMVLADLAVCNDRQEQMANRNEAATDAVRSIPGREATKA